MILIISENDDFTSNDVIDWLIRKKKKFVRFNSEDLIEVELVLNEEIIDISLKQNNESVRLSDINSFWYRRGDLNFNIPLNKTLKFDPFIKQIEAHLISEIEIIKKFIHHELASKNSINSRITSSTNKLLNLKYAMEIGLKIPKTIIAQSKKSVDNYFKGEAIITKAINESIHFESDNEFWQAYTEEISELKKFTFPSLFQTKIEKLFEVRTFMINGIYYSMAIFSQLDLQTKIDFRKYNFIKPNRTVPYKLPKKTEKKLSILAKKIGINCGSFDLVVDEEHNHIFLEVNPVGQFGMISRPCNYSLEEKISSIL